MDAPKGLEMNRGLSALALLVVLFPGEPAVAQGSDSTSTPAVVPSGVSGGASSAKPTVRAQVIAAGVETSIRLDGKLLEPEWATADSIANLIQFEPEEGVAPAGRTVVRVLASPTGLVFGVRCEEDPSAFVAFSKARDIELDEEDHFLILLDTFGDERSGYVFGVNILGSRFDGLINAQGDDVNSSWDALWEAGVSHDAHGWSAEVRIPLQSLTFKNGLDHWGLNVERRVQSLQETSRWSGAKRDFEIFQMTQAGVLTGLPKFDQGLGLTIRPAVAGKYFKPDPGEPRETEAKMSLDVTQRIGSNLTANLTVNTDFAETEVDQRQANLTRFDILFPEKRSFFLEGADIFEFGLGTDLEDATVQPFYSRRIGLFTPEGEDEGTEIPIIAGGKIQGRIGKSNVGALVVGTDAVEDVPVPQTEMGVVRLNRNVFSESTVGLIATSGDPLGRQSWTAGADYTYRTSKFMDDKNLHMGVWAAKVDRDSLEDDRLAYGAKIAYPNDFWDLQASYFRIGEDFDPSLGFVQRVGNIVYGAATMSPRPGGNIRVLSSGASYFQVSNVDGGWESYAATITPVDLLFESGDGVAFNIEPQGERPDEAFDVFSSLEKTVVLQPGEYTWTSYTFTGTLAAQRMISGELSYSFGGFYDGDLQTLTADVFFKPHPIVTFQLTTERNVAKLPEGDFTQYVQGLRSELKPSPQLQLTNFLQYDNETRSLGSASRMRWTFHPQGDLFVTYNQNWDHTLPQPDESFTYLTDELIVKLQYSFRR
jgi:hypothetical protein